MVEINGNLHVYPADVVFRLNNNYIKDSRVIPKENIGNIAPYLPTLGLLIPNDDEMNKIWNSCIGVWMGSNWNCDFAYNLCHDIPILIRCKPRQGMQISSTLTGESRTVLLAADYCQIELRLIAHLSGDTALCDVFNQPNQIDIFKQLAMKWKKKLNVDDVTGIERKQIKQLCYAILYGAGITTLSKQLEVSLEDAHTMLDEFLSTYPGVSKYMKKIVTNCKKCLYVETLLGRRRYLPNIASAGMKLRSQAERQAVNSVCQGSAADLIKVRF